MQTNSSALRCCGEEEEEESGLAPPEKGRPLIIAAQFPICPLGPVGGMNLDRVVGRWELAAAARVSVGPSDKTRPNQARPRPDASHVRARGRLGSAAAAARACGLPILPLNLSM